MSQSSDLALSLILGLSLLSAVSAFRSCFDFDPWQCRALTRLGHCTSPAYAEFTRRVCCRTCGMTVEKTQVCSDTRWECPSWAKDGYCSSSEHTWLREGCCLSCRNSVPRKKKPQQKPNFKRVVTTTRRPTTANSCKNTDSNCSFWAKNGYCPLYPVACCRSCASKKIVKCEDKNKSCEYWSKQGYCVSNRFAIQNCCSSCSKILIETRKRKA